LIDYYLLLADLMHFVPHINHIRYNYVQSYINRVHISYGVIHHEVRRWKIDYINNN